MLIIGIAGGTGCGKTTVVNQILNELPEGEVGVISQDSYYKDTSHLTYEERIKINFDHKGPKVGAEENILLTVYRILQEALNNIVKHSYARQAKVQFFQDEKNISLIIADNGKGFDLIADIKKDSNGISNMKERVDLVNGQFIIESSRTGGTYIKVDLPNTLNEESK